MKMLIVGSTAAERHGLHLREDKPKDVDLFYKIHDSYPVDLTGCEVFWHPSFADWIPDGISYASPDQLLTIKLSHSAWDLKNDSWFKHMNDVPRLQEAGAEVDEKLYASLYAVWEERYGKKKLNLDMDKSNFFNDPVVRKYDHDSLHRSVAYDVGHPLYESFLKEDSEVDMDMTKVWSADVETQIRLFREEIYVTALERWLIPDDYRMGPIVAYNLAAKLTVTSLTKGASSRFIAEHWADFRRPDSNYVQWHLDNKDLLEVS